MSNQDAGTKVLQRIAQLQKQSKHGSMDVHEIEVYYKMPWWCQAAANEMGTLAGRAGFLAGFAYYEFSRQSEANVQRVPYYVALLLGTFTVCIIVVVRNAMIQRLFRQVHRGDLHALPSMMAGKRGYVHTTYRLYQFAFLMYIFALAHMPDVYNETMYDDNPALYHATRYLPYVIVLLAVWVDGTFLTHLNAAYQQKGDWPNLGITFNRDTGLWGPATPETILDPDFKATEAEWRLKAADALGGRALLVLGFVQHGLARYVYLPDGPNGGSDASLQSGKLLNAICWVMMNGVCMLMVLALDTSTHTTIYVKDLEYPQCREHFAGKTRLNWRVASASYQLGMCFLFVAAGLMGWGNSQTCDSDQVPGGACYADVAYVPALVCTIGLIITVYVDVRCRIFAARVKKGAADHSSATVDVDGHEETDSVLNSVVSMGNSATIAAGFSIYNIATYDTDVFRGPLTTSEHDGLFGLTAWGYMFLWANWLAFSLGMAAALTSTSMSTAYEALTGYVERQRFVNAFSPFVRTVGLLFRLSLFSFMIGFALFGMAKMEPQRVEPAVATVIGLVAIIAETLIIKSASTDAGALPEHAKLLYSTHSVDAHGHITHQPHYEKEISQLQAMAPRALMVGGFAYNAVSFMFRPGATFSPSYCLIMGLCFNAALYLTLTASSINQTLGMLRTDARKERFVFRLKANGTLLRSYMMGVGHLLFFICGFSIMGYIKLWTYSPDQRNEQSQVELSMEYGWLQLIGGIVAAVVVLSQTFAISSSAAEVDSMERSALNGIQWKELVSDITARADATTFQTGNVFYEVLFSAVSLNLSWASYLYFGFSVLTLVCGTIATACASQISYHINSLGTDDKKCYFAYAFRSYEQKLFFAFVLSIYSWVCSMFFSAAVKYESRWYISSCWSAFGVLVITESIVYIENLRKRFRPVSLSDPFIEEKERLCVQIQRAWRRKKKANAEARESYVEKLCIEIDQDLNEVNQSVAMIPMNSIKVVQ